MDKHQFGLWAVLALASAMILTVGFYFEDDVITMQKQRIAELKQAVIDNRSSEHISIIEDVACCKSDTADGQSYQMGLYGNVLNANPNVYVQVRISTVKMPKDRVVVLDQQGSEYRGDVFFQKLHELYEKHHNPLDIRKSVRMACLPVYYASFNERIYLFSPNLIQTKVNHEHRGRNARKSAE